MGWQAASLSECCFWKWILFLFQKWILFQAYGSRVSKYLWWKVTKLYWKGSASLQDMHSSAALSILVVALHFLFQNRTRYARYWKTGSLFYLASWLHVLLLVLSDIHNFCNTLSSLTRWERACSISWLIQGSLSFFCMLHWLPALGHLHRWIVHSLQSCVADIGPMNCLSVCRCAQRHSSAVRLQDLPVIAALSFLQGHGNKRGGQMQGYSASCESNGSS